jgi:hypothetical protein
VYSIYTFDIWQTFGKKMDAQECVCFFISFYRIKFSRIIIQMKMLDGVFLSLQDFKSQVTYIENFKTQVI